MSFLQNDTNRQISLFIGKLDWSYTNLEQMTQEELYEIIGEDSDNDDDHLFT